MPTVAELPACGQLRTSMTPDHALVQRMAAGDERALGELYDRH
jgi:hypothetical protein